MLATFYILAGVLLALSHPSFPSGETKSFHTSRVSAKLVKEAKFSTRRERAEDQEGFRELEKRE